VSYLTLTEKSKATTKPWFSRLLRYPARKPNGSSLTYLLTCSGPTQDQCRPKPALQQTDTCGGCTL